MNKPQCPNGSGTGLLSQGLWVRVPSGVDYSRVAQRKRAGPITQRSMDRNHPLLKDFRGSRGLMDIALDLTPEVTRGCGFESRLRQVLSTTEVRPLSKAPNPQLLPGRCTVGRTTAPLGWVKCREHISLLIILCIIVYVYVH